LISISVESKCRASAPMTVVAGSGLILKPPLQ
jgi:hypothetical protein